MKTAIIITSLVFLLLGFFLVSFVVFHNRKQKKNKKEKHQLEQELLRTQLEIQEQTLQTISQEIHDNIGQALSLVKLNLNTIDIGNESELLGKISDSLTLVSKAIQDLRDISKSLNTDNIVSIGLIRAIEYELEMIRKAGFLIKKEVRGTIRKMDPQKELILFRIIQETLNNIIKHADAKSITIN